MENHTFNSDRLSKNSNHINNLTSNTSPTSRNTSKLDSNTCSTIPHTDLSYLSNTKTIIVKNTKGKLLFGAADRQPSQEQQGNDDNEDFEDALHNIRDLLQMGETEIIQQNMS